MQSKYVTKHLVDVFLNQPAPFPTGYEPSCWLRLAKRGTSWVQVAGVHLPAWQFKKIVALLK